MTRKKKPSDAEIVEGLLRVYDRYGDSIALFATHIYTALASSKSLSEQVHSLRWRVKERDRLALKLGRKIEEARRAGEPFSISEENLLTEVTDLAGVRILHLYTRQFARIHTVVLKILEDQQYPLVEGPFARTWDDESREFFQTCGIETQVSPNMYTSVHYVVGSASRVPMTCEIQVRTLMEEVWGEVDHAFNYPEPAKDLVTREQLKALAKVTAGASRLVDTIYLTHGLSEGIGN